MTILLTVLLSFLLSSLIAFTYQKTTRYVKTPVDFLQAIILVAIVAAMVMQAIGDSLARGLGMLGALAIIRFRTNLREPRNMVFTFASLAAGIACGVYGFVIGIVGTIGFCTVTFILKYSPMSRMSPLVGVLSFNVPKYSEDVPELEAILNRFCSRYTKTRSQIYTPKIKGIVEGDPPDKKIDYEYHFKLINEQDGKNLDTALSALETLESLKISFENFPEKI
ncbi:DUF4956 domain-containing protein [Neolewinella agarilytica]|nr:DUF4956 domain-containing protein [Neolewinella agarilytica]